MTATGTLDLIAPFMQVLPAHISIRVVFWARGGDQIYRMFSALLFQIQIIDQI